MASSSRQSSRYAGPSAAGPSNRSFPPPPSNGHHAAPSSHLHPPHASSINGGPLPTSLPQTVQHLINLGAERNMQASQMQGLMGHNRKNTAFTTPALKQLDKETEACWVSAGRLAETLGDWVRALSSYETALRHSPVNIEALTQTANILRQQEKFVEAAEYFTRVIHLNEEAGEVWGALGHCYLMIDDLPKAYACYQQAIMHIPDAKVRRARDPIKSGNLLFSLFFSAIRTSQSSGTALGSCTTAMAAWSTPKKLLPASFKPIPVSSPDLTLSAMAEFPIRL
jgi:tetratricopeptide (TPR) repeat protein